jgi:hypothetical protein
MEISSSIVRSRTLQGEMSHFGRSNDLMPREEWKAHTQVSREIVLKMEQQSYFSTKPKTVEITRHVNLMMEINTRHWNNDTTRRHV